MQLSGGQKAGWLLVGILASFDRTISAAPVPVGTAHCTNNCALYNKMFSWKDCPNTCFGTGMGGLDPPKGFADKYVN